MFFICFLVAPSKRKKIPRKHKDMHYAAKHTKSLKNKQAVKQYIGFDKVTTMGP